MVTFASVARDLSRSPQTLQAWADKGEFPQPLRFNGRRYLLSHQVEAWREKTFASASRDDESRAP
jgi:hypothetical protein